MPPPSKRPDLHPGAMTHSCAHSLSNRTLVRTARAVIKVYQPAAAEQHERIPGIETAEVSAFVLSRPHHGRVQGDLDKEFLEGGLRGVPGDHDLRPPRPGLHHRLVGGRGEAAARRPGPDLALLRPEHRHHGAVLRPHQWRSRQPRRDRRHGVRPQAQPRKGQLLPGRPVPGRHRRSRGRLPGHAQQCERRPGRDCGQRPHLGWPGLHGGAPDHVRVGLHRLRHLRPQAHRPQRFRWPGHRHRRGDRAHVWDPLHWSQYEPRTLIWARSHHMELERPLGVLGGSHPGRDHGRCPLRVPVLPRPGTEKASWGSLLQGRVREVQGG
ncbi:hypothetical protein SKAU_G00379990 [Synaphobranchus kaupii]|uniref:Uncharacterized protein n=1 Tax=Synaphobranchus kaupii TaxID=118154 RepID=A0A9Q1IEL1_SYNKA|nr:hypothetical protein SKAU_G00379990 [Synaphobranchus kaupii]